MLIIDKAQVSEPDLSIFTTLKLQHKSSLLLVVVVLQFKVCLTEMALLLIFSHTHFF